MDSLYWSLSYLAYIGILVILGWIIIPGQKDGGK